MYNCSVQFLDKEKMIQFRSKHKLENNITVDHQKCLVVMSMKDVIPEEEIS
jgi:hypothetical protein